jgi:hypothetical protein
VAGALECAVQAQRKRLVELGIAFVAQEDARRTTLRATGTSPLDILNFLLCVSPANRCSLQR